MGQLYTGAQKVLLCVHDSHAILEYERRVFEQSGHIVVTETSARRGLRLATLFPFDAVLIDYHMPEMSGHELAYELKCLRPETFVVMVSGSEIPVETRLLVDAVVSKDEAKRDLLPIVTRLCDGVSPSER